MNNSCEIVRDLLPLYYDRACSNASRELVREHLDSCPACADIYRQLQNDAPAEQLSFETDETFLRQAKKNRRRGARAGMVLSCIFSVPILVCLIVNLATGHALDWFFLVLASLLLVASVTVVPLTVTKYRLAWTLSAFAAGLVLLFGTCCLYTGGNWFFVASLSSLFGLAVVFLPILGHSAPLRGRHPFAKALVILLIDTLLFAGMLLSIGLLTRSAEFARLAPAISLPFVLYAWGFVILLSLPRVNRPARAGLWCLFSGLWLFFADTVFGGLTGVSYPLPRFSPLRWDAVSAEENILWLGLIAGLLLGVCFLIAGIYAARKERKK